MNTNIPQIECNECKALKPEKDFITKPKIEGNLICNTCRRVIAWKIKNDNNKAYRKKYYEQPRVKEKHKIHSKTYLQRIKSDPDRWSNFVKVRQLNRKNHRHIHTFIRLMKLLKCKGECSTIRPIDLWKIAKRQRCKCALTGRRLTNENISSDHIICKTHGGLTSPENIRLVVKEANIARNTLSDDKFIALCKDVVEYNHA